MLQERMTAAEFLAQQLPVTRHKKPKHDYKRDFLQQLQIARLPAPRTEFRFMRPERQYRLDFAWLDELVAAEYQGGIYEAGKSGHTNVKGFERDCRKFTEANLRGWLLITFTAEMVRNGEALSFIERALKLRGQKQSVRNR